LTWIDIYKLLFSNYFTCTCTTKSCWMVIRVDSIIEHFSFLLVD
jgi:hypothetical protein